jgi:hypothetical protein
VVQQSIGRWLAAWQSQGGMGGIMVTALAKSNIKQATNSYDLKS